MTSGSWDPCAAAGADSGSSGDQDGDANGELDQGGDEDDVVRAIDRCLSRPWRTRRLVARFFRRFAAERNDLGVRALTPSQASDMLADLAAKLQVPEDKMFANRAQLLERFDFSGDGTIDKYECLKLVKYVLRQRRVELRGRTAEISVPESKLSQKGFTVIKELGRGGQGVMYLCSKSMEMHKYCVKFYNKKDANACGLHELIDEYALMQSLSNRHIAQTYEVFQDKDFYYLVNEPYFGGDLTKLAKRAYDEGMPMSEDWWRPIFRQCLDGLAYLHRKAIMHCDIKEPNVMIADGGSYFAPTAVLIDFGLSTQFSNAGDGVSGTPGYIPPETWATGVWYPLGDVFSMGVVFFQLMVGQVPSSAGTVMGVLQPSTDGSALKAAGLAADLPWQRFPGEMPDLRDLVVSMTTRDRSQRPRAPKALEHAWFQSDSDADLPEATLHGLVGGGAQRLENAEVVRNLMEDHNLDELRVILQDLEAGAYGAASLPEGSAATSPAGRFKKRYRTFVGILRRHGLRGEEIRNGASSARIRHLVEEAIFAKAQYSQHYVRELFNDLDSNGDGRLSQDELAALLDSDSFECPYEDINALVEGMCVGQDGEVSLEDFMRAVMEDGRIARREDAQRGPRCSMM